MKALTEKQFCDLYNAYIGEGGLMSGIDSLKQLIEHRFTGETLKEFAEHCINSLPSLTKERVMKAIKDEPELPGVMPHKIYLSVKDDEMALAKLLRITVRKTKQGIKDRVSSLCLEPSPIGNHDELPKKGAKEITYTHICDQCGTRFKDTSPCLLPTHIILCPECNVL